MCYVSLIKNVRTITPTAHELVSPVPSVTSLQSYSTIPVVNANNLGHIYHCTSNSGYSGHFHYRGDDIFAVEKPRKRTLQASTTIASP